VQVALFFGSRRRNRTVDEQQKEIGVRVPLSLNKRLEAWPAKKTTESAPRREDY
jgi:hypothetical protein